MGVNRREDEVLELAAGYVLGALDPAERRSVESRLAAGDAELERAISEFSPVTTALAASAPPAMPSPDLKRRVLAAVASDANAAREPVADRGRIVEMRPARSRAALWSFGALAAAAALAVTTALTWIQARDLSSELEASRGELSQLQQQLEDERRWAQVLTASGARAAALEMTTSGEALMRARATYDPASRRAVIVFENIQVPSGRDLELWALNAGGVASLGLIRPDDNGRAVLHLENAGDPASLAGFAVSLEAAGGSTSKTAPQGPVVMAGKFGS
jgi:anti-sigma-K factor RskA